MVKGAAGGVDLADRQAGAVGHLPGDVRVGDILIGLRAPAAVEPVRNVIAAQGGAAPSRVVLRFEAGDLPLDQGLGGAAARRCVLDGDGGADVAAKLTQDVAVRVVERDCEHVWQMLVEVNDNLLQQPFEAVRQRRAADVDFRPVVVWLRHRFF